MKTVAILGTGPAGLLAAHACKLAGVAIHLFSVTDSPSKISGAQFVHRPVPLLCDPAEEDALITYKLAGSSDGYQAKVYGENPVSFVSMERIQDGWVVPAWGMDRIYETLWSDIAGGGASINQVDVTPAVLEDWVAKRSFSHIVSTIPKPLVCCQRGNHSFKAQTIKVSDQCAFGDQAQENTVYYDGTPNVSWYRTANLFGVGSTEWGASLGNRTVPYAKTREVTKPTMTDCRCWSGQVFFTGRYGTWTKGILAHQAFDDMAEILGLL